MDMMLPRYSTTVQYTALRDRLYGTFEGTVRSDPSFDVITAIARGRRHSFPEQSTR